MRGETIGEEEDDWDLLYIRTDGCGDEPGGIRISADIVPAGY